MPAPDAEEAEVGPTADLDSDRQNAAAAPVAAAPQPSAELRASSSGGPTAPLRRRFIRSELRPAGSQAPATDATGSAVSLLSDALSL